uniref:Uncharacterized protein n=1 Tax=Panagrolaimus sp. PS1159 TaxID=55785 RepID=A0AC35G996_9BILA
MADDNLAVEKHVRYLVETGVIKSFNKEEEVMKHMRELKKYRWKKGESYECHDAAAYFCSHIFRKDEFCHFSHFKWLVLWLKTKRICSFAKGDKVKEVRDEMLQEFLTVKNLLQKRNLRRSEFQFSNIFTEVYHVYAHYTDTRHSSLYKKDLIDLKLDESFLRGPFPPKLKDHPTVERCFVYYFHHLPNLVFQKKHLLPTTSKANTDEWTNKNYQADDVKGFLFQFKKGVQQNQWRVSTVYGPDPSNNY